MLSLPLVSRRETRGEVRSDVTAVGEPMNLKVHWRGGLVGDHRRTIRVGLDMSVLLAV